MNTDAMWAVISYGYGVGNNSMRCGMSTSTVFAGIQEHIDYLREFVRTIEPKTPLEVARVLDECVAFDLGIHDLHSRSNDRMQEMIESLMHTHRDIVNTVYVAAKSPTPNPAQGMHLLPHIDDAGRVRENVRNIKTVWQAKSDHAGTRIQNLADAIARGDS